MKNTMMTSDQCVENFKKEYSYRLEMDTVNHYYDWVIQLLTFSGKHFQSITTRDIRNWMIYLERDKNKATTIKTKLFGVKLFYRYCVEEGLISHNPVEKITFPKIEESIPHYLQLEQLTELRELVKSNKQQRAIIELLFATGIRLGELLALKIEDINWSERIITIQQGKRKKGRIVLFTRYCGEHLKAYLETRNDSFPFLFLNYSEIGPIPARTIQSQFEVYTKKLEFKISPHTLRHTFAAHLAMKGMPLGCIQDLLGHDDPHQTQLYSRLYSHARKEVYDELM